MQSRKNDSCYRMLCSYVHLSSASVNIFLKPTFFAVSLELPDVC